MKLNSSLNFSLKISNTAVNVASSSTLIYDSSSLSASESSTFRITTSPSSSCPSSNTGNNTTYSSESYSIKSKKDSTDYKDETDTKRNYPIVVLINGNSASASEILASSLKHSYGATIIGTKSFGKGKVQTTGTLEDGTMIKYTSARWFMPNGECIDEKGIVPDIEIELSEEFKNNPVEENDNQLNEAIKVLTS